MQRDLNELLIVWGHHWSPSTKTDTSFNQTKQLTSHQWGVSEGLHMNGESVKAFISKRSQWRPLYQWEVSEGLYIKEEPNANGEPMKPLTSIRSQLHAIKQYLKSLFSLDASCNCAGRDLWYTNMSSWYMNMSKTWQQKLYQSMLIKQPHDTQEKVASLTGQPGKVPSVHCLSNSFWTDSIS